MSKSRLYPQYNLPIYLNTERVRALVVGGGAVGRRKAILLLTSGASVRVVALEPRPADFDHERLEWCVESYKADHLRDINLVFTAAGPAVGEAVEADARDRGIWVCRADDVFCGDFVTPTVLGVGRFLKIAISTGGASPAIAARIRDGLAAEFDDSFGAWVDLLAFERLQANYGIWEPPAGREEYLKQISDWSWLERYRSEGRVAVMQAYRDLAGQLGLRGHIL